MGGSKKNRDPSSMEYTPVKKKYREESDMEDDAMSQSKLTDNSMTMPAPSPRPGSASHSRAEAPPNWFVEFKARQLKQARFEMIIVQRSEAHAATDYVIKNLKDEVENIKKKPKFQDSKLDDLENRNRNSNRNNIVIFNVPEGFEGDNCLIFIQKLLKNNGNIQPKFIRRCHRNGKPGPKPRPFMSGLAFIPKRRNAIRLFLTCSEERKFVDAKLFASNDFSQTVQQMRKTLYRFLVTP